MIYMTVIIERLIQRNIRWVLLRVSKFIGDGVRVTESPKEPIKQ